MRDHRDRFEPLLRSIYRIALLALLPRWFRVRWSADMRIMFRERLREAADSGGFRAAVATGSRELGSVAFAAFQSRLEQATGRVHRAREAQDGSGVWRTDPVPAFFPRHDLKGLKVASIGALACHFALFMVVLPGSGNMVLPTPDEPVPRIARILRPPPPERPKVPVVGKPVRGAISPVPLPDPTPDAPEPIYEWSAAASFYDSISLDTEYTVEMPAAPPPTPERVRAGTDVERPVVLHKVVPEYPTLAVRAQHECSVILEAVIGKQGEVIDVQVARGCRMGLNEAAIAAVQQWHYTPTLLNGRPVEVILLVTAQFELR